MQIPDVQLETERLLLRVPQGQDFEAWAAFMADVERTQYIGGAQPRSLAWRGLMTMVGSWAVLGFGMFSVIEKSSGRWIGRIGPWQPEGWPGTEVGWSLVSDAGGRGYATDGATAAIGWAFDTLGWSEVIHTIDPANVASKGVAARLGSRYLRMGRLPAPHDVNEVEVWGQSREEWFVRRKEQRQ